MIYIPARIATSETESLCVFSIVQDYVQQVFRSQLGQFSSFKSIKLTKKVYSPAGSTKRPRGVQNGPGEYGEYKKPQGSTYSPGEYCWSLCHCANSWRSSVFLLLYFCTLYFVIVLIAGAQVVFFTFLFLYFCTLSLC